MQLRKRESKQQQSWHATKTVQTAQVTDKVVHRVRETHTARLSSFLRQRACIKRLPARRLHILSTHVAGKDSNTSSTQSRLPGDYTFCQEAQVKTATLPLHNKEIDLISQNLARSEVWPDADRHARASAGCQEQSKHTGLLPHQATACTGLDVTVTASTATPRGNSYLSE